MGAINTLAVTAVEDVLTGSWGERMLQGLKFSVVGILTVMAVLGVIALFTLAFSKIMGSVGGKKKEAAPAPAPAAAPAEKKEEADDGRVKLVDVDDQTAAVIMAIVSDRSGIPLERLRFKSIRLAEEKEVR